ncbi:MAG: hypothetical protein Q4A76_02615 [Porphyromonadaceae bacterium]|nr:hypothetical protein [Porphyromonadaceae bacterium]
MGKQYFVTAPRSANKEKLLSSDTTKLIRKLLTTTHFGINLLNDLFCQLLSQPKFFVQSIEYVNAQAAFVLVKRVAKMIQLRGLWIRMPI